MDGRCPFGSVCEGIEAVADSAGGTGQVSEAEEDLREADGVGGDAVDGVGDVDGATLVDGPATGLDGRRRLGERGRKNKPRVGTRLASGPGDDDLEDLALESTETSAHGAILRRHT